MLDYDTRDESEQIYIGKFTALAAAHGIPITYTTDRAALDIGLHLTVRKTDKMKGVTGSRVWFQFKGQATETLSLEKYENADAISQSVKIEHLRQWYRYGEPVYLVVYVEAADKFFAQDIHKFINDKWGDRIFKDDTFPEKNGKPQKSINIHLPKETTEVNEAFWLELKKHRSMRVDLESYQGRPLADSHNFQARILRMMDPEVFEDIIGQLLVAHRFRLQGSAKDVSSIYPAAGANGDRVAVLVGKLFEPFQYDHYLTRELVPDDDDFREDGQQFRAHGGCAVIIHSDVKSRPEPQGIAELAKFLDENGAKQILVFVNHYMTSVAEWDGKKAYNCFPEFSTGFGGTGIDCVPLHLEDLGKTILLSTNVYLEIREDLEWLGDEVERKIESGEYRVMSPEDYFEALRKRND